MLLRHCRGSGQPDGLVVLVDEHKAGLAVASDVKFSAVAAALVEQRERG